MKRVLVASGAASIVLGAAVLGAASAAPEARAGGRAKKGEERDLVVTLVTPTLNQEVASDFTDPGLGKVITVRFSSSLRRGDIISDSNVYNRLTPKVELADSKFLRLPGNPTVNGSVFRFDPLSVTPTGTLPAGQYTLTMKSSIRNTTGHLLNSGLRDFVTTFSVGTDVYPPVLRKASPINNQINIGLNQRIVLTFNEPIDATSIASTITVQNVSVNPPSTILGQGGTGITLERNGFDVVFTPDPCFGYPPLSAIQMTVQGKPLSGPSPATVTDEFQNLFARDPGLQWTPHPTIVGQYDSPNGIYNETTGQFRLTFTTKGIVPPPNLIAPGSPNFLPPMPYANPCYTSCVYFTPSCKAIGSGMYYTTGNGIGQVDLRPFFARQIQNAGNTLYDPLLYNLIANAPVRTGRPTGIMVDPRWDPAAGPAQFHTFVYVADGRSKTVQVLDSRNFKRLGFFGGFTEPSDVAISNTLNNDRTTLLVSDRAASNVTFVDLQTFTVTLSGQPATPGSTAPPSPCAALKETLENRIILAVGAGPTTINADSFLQSKAISTNSLENSVSIIDIKQAKVLQTAKTGSNPVEADFSFFGFGAVDLGVIVNQGGLVDPSGSASVYFRAPTLQPLFYPARATTHDAIEATFTDGVKNPTAIWAVQQWIACSGNSIPTQSYYISNTGTDTVMDLTLIIQGLFGLNITVAPRFVHKVGLNPTSAMYDAFNPAIPSLWIAIGGEGRFAGMDPNRSIKPRGRFVPGIRRLYTAFSH